MRLRVTLRSILISVTLIAVVFGLSVRRIDRQQNDAMDPEPPTARF